MHGGFEVWLLRRHGPNLCFLMAFELSTRFPQQKSGDTSPYFRSGNQCVTLGDMDCDNHIRMGGASIYIYIHHAQCKHEKQESKCLHP